MEALKAKGQVGHPPKISTDAHLGNSAIEDQSGEVLFGPCERDGSISVRLEGCYARARPGAKNELALGAKVAYCS